MSLHGLHASQITSSKTLYFKCKLFLMCSMKYVWSWSHASWATNHKTSLKKLLAVCPKGLTRKRKRINGNSNYKECQLESFLHYLQMQKHENYPRRRVTSSKSKTLPLVFFTFFKSYKWYQIGHSISYTNFIFFS